MFAQPLVIPPSQAGQRLDRALATLTSATRSHVKRLIDAGCIQVAGERKKAGYQVHAEEEIDVLPRLGGLVVGARGTR